MAAGVQADTAWLERGLAVETMRQKRTYKP